MIETIIIVLGFLVIQLANLYFINQMYQRSVHEAAKRAAESTRKNLENKMYKLNPWLKGFDPNKVVQITDDEEVEVNG